MSLPKRSAPKHLIAFINEPDKWNPVVFEAAICKEVEDQTGTLTPSDALLIGMLITQVNAFVESHAKIQELGSLYAYNSGEATSPWTKLRNETLDRTIKLLGELGLVARGRPKKQNKASDVDELFLAA